MITRRTHVINYLINSNKYITYLEIGVRNPSFNFDSVECEFKDGVDINPESNCKYIMTSDDFFCKNI